MGPSFLKLFESINSQDIRCMRGNSKDYMNHSPPEYNKAYLFESLKYMLAHRTENLIKPVCKPTLTCHTFLQYSVTFFLHTLESLL
jgi:hypothetical protein